MKYTLNKYEKQLIDNMAVIFLVDDNNNVMHTKCLALEGTGMFFFECIENNKDIQEVEQILLSQFKDIDESIIKQDLLSFAESLCKADLLCWSEVND